MWLPILRCEIRSEINGIGNIASYWVSSWDSWLFLSYLSWILRVFFRLLRSCGSLCPVVDRALWSQSRWKQPQSRLSLPVHPMQFWVFIFLFLPFTHLTVESTTPLPPKEKPTTFIPRGTLIKGFPQILEYKYHNARIDHAILLLRTESYSCFLVKITAFVI